MKKYIRAMLSDLRKPRKDFTPSIPAASTNAPVLHLDPLPQCTDPKDLSNQELSSDPSERLRQLDYQAHRLQEKGTLEG